MKEQKTYREDYFSRIDTKQKAYIIGYILGNGNVTKDREITITTDLRDRAVLDFIAGELGGRVRTSTRTDLAAKIYPHAALSVTTRMAQDARMLIGGCVKKDRHVPRVRLDLESYLVQGIFDAKGRLTWGHRKDRVRVWQTVSIASPYKVLVGIQNILCKNGITSALRKKADGSSYVIEISNPRCVLMALNYLYRDPAFVVLQRKYEKFIALRLELGEFGESLQGQYRAKPAEREGVETSGDVATCLNNRASAQAPSPEGVRDSPTLVATRENVQWGQTWESLMSTIPTFGTLSMQNRMIPTL